MKFNRHLKFIILNVLVALPVFTNAQGFSWAQGFIPTYNGVSSPAAGTATTAVDANNNVYSIVGFTGTVDFDQSPNTYSLTSTNRNNMALLKEDAAGNFQWVKQFRNLRTTPNSGTIGVSNIVLDGAGNIYIGGEMSDSFDFDPGPNVYMMTTIPTGNIAFYVVKLTSTGDFVWAKQIAGSAVGSGVSGYGNMTIDAAANIYFSTGFSGTIDANPGLAILSFTATAYADILIEKLDSTGNFIWAKQVGGKAPDVAMGITIDTISNIYITGVFSDTVDFDPGIGTAYLQAPFSSNFTQSYTFIAKYDSAGNYVWAKEIGMGGNGTYADEIDMGRRSTIVITGYFGGTVDFDPGPGVYNLTSNSTRSIFTLKLRNNGDFAWAKKAGYNTGLYEGRGITTDTVGNVYVVSNSYPLQKFDSSGNLLWTLATAGTSGWVTLDNDNAIYLSGSFSGIEDFDPGPGVFNLTGANNSGFILKLCDSIPPIPLTVSSTTACIGDTVTINAPSFVPLPVIWTQYGVSTPLPDTGLSIKVTTTGLYQIKVANSLCPWVGSVYVHVYPPSNPSISLPPPSGAVWAGQQVSINATVSNFVTAFKIDWYKNGSLLSTTPPQATLLQYTKTAGTDTIKAVVYEWSNPCSVPDTSNMVLVQEALGVADVQKQSLTLYPIPCQDWLYISGVARGDRLLLCDLSGRTVLAATAEGQQQQINTSALAAGCYMLRVIAINKQTKGTLPVVKR